VTFSHLSCRILGDPVAGIIDLGDNPTRTQSTLMILFGFFSLWIITLHFYDLRKIQDYRKKSKDIRIPTFMLLNILTVFEGAGGFGRPIAPVIVTFIDLVVLIVIGYNLPSLIEWIDKLFYIITSLSIAFEYFFMLFGTIQDRDKIKKSFLWFLYVSISL
jgi:hypothetical protein